MTPTMTPVRKRKGTEADTSRESRKRGSGAAASQSAERVRVLVVMRDADERAAVSKHLKKMASLNATVRQAASVDECKDMLDEGKTDVALIEFDPGKARNARAVGELGGRRGETALIFLLGPGNGDTKRRALEAGAMHLVSRDGLAPDILENAIHSSLHAQQIETRLNDALVDVERANRARSDFFAKMGHDLKTPLNSVIGYSDALASEAFGPLGDEKYKEYAFAIRESGAHLLELIENLIHFSIGEAKEIAFASCDLNELTASAIRMSEPIRQKRGHKLTAKYASKPVTLSCQGSAITQTIINLLTNAIKYTPENGRIEVKVRQTTRHAEVSIKDNGIGMSQADISVALQPFGRVQLPPESAQDGTGLGLHIVREIMARHRGQLDLASAPGKGTTAVLRLPLKQTAKRKR